MVKQETLKEAADKYVDINYYNYIKPLEKEAAIENFIEGAQWQAERMYSEEDLRTAWIAAKNSSDFNEWFEQFKKK